MERIAVVGGGLMGHGIAQVFAVAGHAVVVTDPDERTLSSLPSRVAANLRLLGVDPAPADAIELAGDLRRAVTDAAFVVEAAFEDLTVKRALFAEMSAYVGEDAILATNTSVISISEIAEAARKPERVVGTHFWNPPYLVPLVEVVQAAQTSSTTIAETMRLLASVGKAPVHVRKDVPGFVGNRMQHALWREAIAIVESGVADAEAVDEIVRNSFGLRLAALGPLENADLIGLDLTLAIHCYLLPHLDARPTPSPMLRALVAEGRLGMKSGGGLRQWTEASAADVRTRLINHLMDATAPPTKGARATEAREQGGDPS